MKLGSNGQSLFAGLGDASTSPSVQVTVGERRKRTDGPLDEGSSCNDSDRSAICSN
jgi:hypothetical protein